MLKRVLAGLVILASISETLPSAYAQGDLFSFETGDSLVEDCLSNSPELQSHCVGYIAAVADTLSASPIGDFHACIPGGRGVSEEQLKAIVLNWLRSRAGERRFTAAGLVAEALSEAFPCG